MVRGAFGVCSPTRPAFLLLLSPSPAVLDLWQLLANLLNIVGRPLSVSSTAHPLQRRDVDELSMGDVPLQRDAVELELDCRLSC